jgi:anti-sigma B factor antagonist
MVPQERNPIMIENLHVTQVVHDRAVIVAVAGEVDMSTIASLRKGLAAACRAASPPRAVVVDLRAVRFFSAAGITALLVTDSTCRAKDVVLHVVADNRVVLRPLQITELIATLRVIPTLRPEWARRQRTTTRAPHTVLDAARKLLLDDRLTNTPARVD